MNENAHMGVYLCEVSIDSNEQSETLDPDFACMNESDL